MEQLPSVIELRSYTYDRLNAAIEQHEINIQTYHDVIQQEQKRIEWIKAVIKAKQELEDGGISINTN